MFQYIGMNRVQVFYKAGSGFRRDATAQAKSLLTRGSSGDNVRWRLSGDADVKKLQKEMTDLFNSMYRRTTIERDEKGKITQFTMSKKAYWDIGNRAYNLASKIANSIEIFDQTAYDNYATLREQAKGMKLSDAQKREIRDSLRGQQRILIQKGRSDAGSRAEEGGYQTDDWVNTDIARKLNENINVAKESIWHSVHKEGKNAAAGYTLTIQKAIFNRFKKVERAAAGRRRK